MVLGKLPPGRLHPGRLPPTLNLAQALTLTQGGFVGEQSSGGGILRGGGFSGHRLNKSSDF